MMPLPTECTYRGEGNNNIVLSNNKGLIYRIRKDSSNSQVPNKKTTAFKKNLHLTVLFGQNRMAHFFTSELLPSSYLVDVDSTFLEDVHQRFQSLRPEFRLNRNVDLNSSRILVAPDATQMPLCFQCYGEGPTVCVEIKPKFGAIPQGIERDLIEQVKRRNAIFCLMQHHRSKRAMWSQRSSYCPCDLFSGDRERMLHALDCLFTVPNNNLRVFLDSRIVFNNDVDSLHDALNAFFNTDSLRDNLDGSLNHTPAITSATANEKRPSCPHNSTAERSPSCHVQIIDYKKTFIEEFLLAALLFRWTSSCDPVLRPPEFSYNCEMHSNSGKAVSDLPLSSVLGRILSAQLISSLGHEDIIQPFSEVQSYFNEMNIKWNSFIAGKVFLDKSKSSDSLLNSLTLVENHLVAMVARDCSLMVCFRFAKPDCPNWVPTVGGASSSFPRMIIHATVVDLDPKRLTNLAERVTIENEVVSDFLSSTASQ